MDIERPNASALTPADLHNLELLKSLVEKAISDGVLTPDEEQSIKQAIWKDHKVSPQELEVVQRLVWDKVQRGELVLSW